MMPLDSSKDKIHIFKECDYILAYKKPRKKSLGLLNIRINILARINTNPPRMALALLPWHLSKPKYLITHSTVRAQESRDQEFEPKAVSRAMLSKKEAALYQL